MHSTSGKKNIWYYICDERFTYFPIKNPAPLFQVIDSRPSRYWRMELAENGLFILAFEHWFSLANYYEKLTDKDEEAVLIFEKYKELIDAEVSEPLPKPLSVENLLESNYKATIGDDLAALIAVPFVTKYVEKIGEALGEKTVKQMNKFWQLIQQKPAGILPTLKSAETEAFPIDFYQAIQELEAAANQDPEVKQALIDVVEVAKQEDSEYVNNLESEVEKIKSQGVTAKSSRSFLMAAKEWGSRGVE
ncbi:hypothetical protein [Okeania sp. SIO3B5]|uniref:hypothetical protein n=1 Tax=Okeania sp. SIO3B5 TaxID=2607811 RepID=UPI0025F0D97F|nr:hypothetical protein [Okeania sp. SIO3B5]